MVFASSLYCWAFSIPTFARIWARKLGVKPGLLVRHLWGDFVFNVKTVAVSRYTPESKAKPMFVAMILDPIWQIYEATVLEEDLQKVGKMVKRLDLVSDLLGGTVILCRCGFFLSLLLRLFLSRSSISCTLGGSASRAQSQGPSRHCLGYLPALASARASCAGHGR